MEVLTIRQKFILNNLIEKGPLTTKGLSQQIDVSERTILREISSINAWLTRYNLRISEVGGKVQINGDRDALDKIREKFDGIPHIWMLTQEQRQVLITAQLLLAREPIKAAYFSYQFNVVEGTVQFYLDRIEAWLRTKNLKLVRRRGYGLEVAGTDWNKRNAFTELLYNYKSISELLEFLYEEDNDYLLNTFFKVTFGEELIRVVKGILKKLYSGGAVLKGDDVSYFGTFIHLLLAIERTKCNLPIELPEYLIKEALSSYEGSFISGIDKLLIDNGIKLPESEIAYLAIHLYGDNYIHKDENGSKEPDFDLDESIKEILNKVCKKLNIKLSYDEQLITGLKQHIRPALYRLTMGLEIRNPMLKEIREYYSELFEAVDFACKLVFSKYNLTVPANEVGYITMHIGGAMERQQGHESKLRVLVICPNGISTAKILCSKLKSRFSDIDEIEVCSLRDMEKVLVNGYDFILSTVSINNKLYGEIVTISPLLLNKDIDKINDLIKHRKAEANNSSNNFLPVFDNKIVETEANFNEADNMLKNFMLKNISVDSFKAAIYEIINVLHASGVIRESTIVENQIKKREEKGSVVIPGRHVALIHVRTEEIGTPFLGVFRMEQFIEMKGIGVTKENVDTILVMLGRRLESDYILELLGKVSVAMVENESFTGILRLGDIIDIRNELVQIINKEVN